MQTTPLGVEVEPDPTLTATPVIGVARIGGAFRVVAVQPLAVGDRVLHLEGILVSAPTRYTVQVGAQEHVEMPPGSSLAEQLDRYSWRFLNHSCEPNARIDGRELVALRAIAPWEEVTFDYATTEYDMAEPFACGCGAASCIGRVRGYRWLAEARRKVIRDHVAPHVLELHAQRARSPRPTRKRAAPSNP
ncbi:MAG: SET domain-containing protein-lysine N-methyltransferase [Planctomycetes bacterium]|nr:SET domain-containing protein-lysine N-methyltransferase [Planctomycetota bacterium]